MEDCIFCQIIKGERPADLVFQDESLVVFKDIRPQAPVHLLIVPRKHIRSVNDLTEEDGALIARMILKTKEIAGAHSIAGSGYKLVLNVERGGGQFVFHLHLHLVGGW
ncbi:MAG TPA: histidine triad nucleotide-binding protein [bacterium]|nr:histidine triad nucleotide-binding protein [bacterium]